MSYFSFVVSGRCVEETTGNVTGDLTGDVYTTNTSGVSSQVLTANVGANDMYIFAGDGSVDGI